MAEMITVIENIEMGYAEHVDTWEMECLDQAWNDWFETNHKYACSDREHFQSIIKPYTCFVGIYIKLL